jgi:Flp pilus assembly protein TadD
MLHLAKSPFPALRSTLTGLLAAGLLSAGSAWSQQAEQAEVSRLLRAGQFTEALAKADQHLAANPKDAQMRFLKGVVQSESGRTTEAMTTFTDLTREFPELPEPYNNLAVLQANQGQFEKARVSLEMAVRTNPSYATAHENLGDVYAKLAAQSYARAQQIDPANITAGPKLNLTRSIFAPPKAPAGKSR